MVKKSAALTRKQEEAFWLLSRWLEENNKTTATYQELCDLFGLSLAPVNYLLNQLKAKGYIGRRGGKRGAEIKILKQISPVELLFVPIIGVVCNDCSMLFHESVGRVKIPSALAEGRRVFAMKFLQNSQADDTVMLFREWQIPKQSNMVLLQYNDQLLIRKIRITPTEVLLAPRSNPTAYTSISPSDSLRIIAVLLSIHRNGELRYE